MQPLIRRAVFDKGICLLYRSLPSLLNLFILNDADTNKATSNLRTNKRHGDYNRIVPFSKAGFDQHIGDSLAQEIDALLK